MLNRLRVIALLAPLAVLTAAVPASADPPPPAAQSGAQSGAQSAPQPVAAAKPLIGKPNPAAVNCRKLGGTSEITVNKRGDEYGWCKLPTGKICEEWALLQDKACIEQKGR